MKTVIVRKRRDDKRQGDFDLLRLEFEEFAQEHGLAMAVTVLGKFVEKQSITRGHSQIYSRASAMILEAGEILSESPTDFNI